MKRKTPQSVSSTTRRSLFDSLPKQSTKNLYCRLENLSNEASVEKFFVDRMLEDLGYADQQIQTKKSISELTVSLGGAKTVKYKPDYVMTFRRKPKWVLDAKAARENLGKWVPQCSGYCLALNQNFKNENPAEHFVLTNGIETKVYKWDVAEPILELAFADFAIGNPKYEQLRAILSSSGVTEPEPMGETFVFERPTPEQMKTLFAACHQVIWKSEGSNPTAAFMEFTKLMFVKLWCDRKLRDDPYTKTLLEQSSKVKLRRSAVTFSEHWIKSQTVAANPVNDILFRTLRESIEKDIADRKKKRIFNRDENIDLRPDTIRAVVKKLEHFDMFGIDEDLNGRLFETFLNATMRGKELGQYFTPRSIVKLMTRLAKLRVSRQHVDRCLDACCGTGGFLIEALTEMRNSVRNNKSLNESAKETLIDQICNKSLYGIDFGKAPPVARIARINMYLHGDGGSRIYYADALDKKLTAVPGQEVEILRDQEELKVAIDRGLRFECALSNPPFSMTKERGNETEERILKQYQLSKVSGTTRVRSSLRSNAMFMERYRDLLVDGGRLLTVIDDGLLAGDDFANVRDFLRDEFIIRAIISLPGDAFQRSGARAKTSVLYLEKRAPRDTSQPDAFVYECRYVGLDDVVPKTRASVAEKARQKAAQEIEEVLTAFDEYMDGKIGPWLVSATSLADRLDAKSLRPWRATELEPTWRSVGAHSEVLANLVEPVWQPVTLKSEVQYTYLRVTYSGFAERGESTLGREVTYSEVSTAKGGDIIVSHINAVNRAICVLPKSCENLLISKEYTILRPKKNKVDPHYLWAVLRSSAIVAEWLSGSKGVGRHRVGWSLLRNQKIPLYQPKIQRSIGDRFRTVEKHEAKIAAIQNAAIIALEPLELEGDVATDRLARAKPPK